MKVSIKLGRLGVGATFCCFIGRNRDVYNARLFLLLTTQIFSFISGGFCARGSEVQLAIFFKTKSMTPVISIPRVSQHHVPLPFI